MARDRCTSWPFWLKIHCHGRCSVIGRLGVTEVLRVLNEYYVKARVWLEKDHLALSTLRTIKRTEAPPYTQWQIQCFLQ